jgi:hypothetical protein
MKVLIAAGLTLLFSTVAQAQPNLTSQCRQDYLVLQRTSDAMEVKALQAQALANTARSELCILLKATLKAAQELRTFARANQRQCELTDQILRHIDLIVETREHEIRELGPSCNR